MKGFPESMKSLITEFSKMPGIGPKSAQRLAFFILTRPSEEAEKLSNAILKLKKTVKFCKLCNNLSDRELCDICANPSRDKSVLCVVEKPSDVISIEKMGDFKGLYHVLLGVLSPLDGVGPKDLKIDELAKRVRKEKIAEVIIATDSNTEGEATALYLTRLLKPLGVKTYRIAYGIPVGANLEYADQATLYKAFEGKREV
ncbi:MAG: recombination protein RecR [Candidatus Omnitrophica bacterium]|nr:recombination protein RecR [Candidatus Omnitrophota bacterium]